MARALFNWYVNDMERKAFFTTYNIELMNRLRQIKMNENESTNKSHNKKENKKNNDGN
jgi:hypothetical protein